MKYKRKTEVDARQWDGTKKQGSELIEWVKRSSLLPGDITYGRAFWGESKMYSRGSSEEPEVVHHFKVNNFEADPDGDVVLEKGCSTMYPKYWLVYETGKGFAAYSEYRFKHEFEEQANSFEFKGLKTYTPCKTPSDKHTPATLQCEAKNRLADADKARDEYLKHLGEAHRLLQEATTDNASPLAQASVELYSEYYSVVAISRCRGW